MDTDVLVVAHSDPDMAGGEAAAQALHGEPALDVRAVIWWYDVEAGKWKLLVSTPVYNQKGPREAYSLIRKTLDDHDLLGRIPLDRVWAVEEEHGIVSAIRNVFGTSAHVRLSNVLVSGISVADAYVLLMTKKRAGIRRKRHA